MESQGKLGKTWKARLFLFSQNFRENPATCFKIMIIL